MAKAKKKRKLSAYNKHMSREMKKGRSFKQAVSSWKGGGRKSSKPKKRSIRRSSRTKPKTGGRKTMGKSGFNSQKIMKYIRLAALATPAVIAMTGPGTIQQKAQVALSSYTGVWSDGSFHPETLAKGWMPYLAAVLTTYGIPKVAGIIRGP